MIPYPSIQELNQFIAEGLCSRRKHPKLPLWIHNYTTKCQHTYTAATWPEPLRDARGLILDAANNIVARGFRKFFNLSQLPDWPRGEPEFWEKADGSLILAFLYEGSVVTSTRGSFESDQSLWAARMLPQSFVPEPGLTYCFEAIYPGNRIVVDYGGKEELVFLAALDSQAMDVTGANPPPSIRRAVFFGQMEASHLPAEQQGEGFVLRWPCGTRAKVKLDEYTRVHRLIFGLSTRAIWEMLRAGEDPASRFHELPADLRAWADQKTAEYRNAHREFTESVNDTFLAFPNPTQVPRSEFAAWAKSTRYPKLMFHLLDSKPIEGEVWKLMEPAFERPSAVDRMEAEA